MGALHASNGTPAACRISDRAWRTHEDPEPQDCRLFHGGLVAGRETHRFFRRRVGPWPSVLCARSGRRGGSRHYTGRRCPPAFTAPVLSAPGWTIACCAGLDRLPVRVERLEMSNGARSLWREIMPSDPAGVQNLYAVQISPDRGWYFYSYWRVLSDL